MIAVHDHKMMSTLSVTISHNLSIATMIGCRHERNSMLQPVCSSVGVSLVGDLIPGWLVDLVDHHSSVDQRLKPTSIMKYQRQTITRRCPQRPGSMIPVMLVTHNKMSITLRCKPAHPNGRHTGMHFSLFSYFQHVHHGWPCPHLHVCAHNSFVPPRAFG